MGNEEILPNSSQDDYLEELVEKLSNPIHRRIIQAYQGSDPIQSMESELANILIEVLHRED